MVFSSRRQQNSRPLIADRTRDAGFWFRSVDVRASVDRHAKTAARCAPSFPLSTQQKGQAVIVETGGASHR
jgi:hypothetical protein